MSHEQVASFRFPRQDSGQLTVILCRCGQWVGSPSPEGAERAYDAHLEQFSLSNLSLDD